eukprot:PhM_4_TR18738/c0_g1_i1/m.65877
MPCRRSQHVVARVLLSTLHCSQSGRDRSWDSIISNVEPAPAIIATRNGGSFVGDVPLLIELLRRAAPTRPGDWGDPAHLSAGATRGECDVGCTFEAMLFTTASSSTVKPLGRCISATDNVVCLLALLFLVVFVVVTAEGRDAADGLMIRGAIFAGSTEFFLSRAVEDDALRRCSKPSHGTSRAPTADTTALGVVLVLCGCGPFGTPTP